MWEAMHAEAVVARYVDLRDRVMNPDFPEGQSASFWTTLTQLEDRLGLTPMAMMKLQWEIDGTADEGDNEDQAPGDNDADAHIIDLQARAGFAK